MTNLAISPINATAPYAGVSGRYAFLPTTQVIDILQEDGWTLRETKVAKVRREDKQGFQKHLLRFVNPSLPKVEDRGKSKADLELLYFNSHDGAGIARMTAGLISYVCMNGLIVSDAMFGDLKVRHTGNARQAIIEGTYEVIERVPRIVNKIDEFRGLSLRFNEVEEFNREAVEIRWGKESPVSPDQLRIVRRSEDTGNDLWTVYQRAQEHLIRGGLNGWSTTGRRMTARPIRAIDKTIQINKDLWSLTESWAEKLAA